jgi:hypothetical protein
VYVEKLDLLRNMIDSFYHSDNPRFISLLLDAFINLSAYGSIRNALVSSELSDKVCWLMMRKEDAFRDIRGKCIFLLLSLVAPETVFRIV